MRILIAYDIAYDNRRSLVSAALDRFGARLQYSVYAVPTDSRQRSQTLVDELAPLLVEGDRLLVVPTCGRCRTSSVGTPLEPLSGSVVL